MPADLTAARAACRGDFTLTAHLRAALDEVDRLTLTLNVERGKGKPGKGWKWSEFCEYWIGPDGIVENNDGWRYYPDGDGPILGPFDYALDAIIAAKAATP